MTRGPVSVISVNLPSCLALFIILHPAHKEAIERGDRVMIDGQEPRSLIDPKSACTHLHDVKIIVCYEEDSDGLTRFIEANRGNPETIMKFVTRRWDNRQVETVSVPSNKSFAVAANREVN